ncbi:non-heme iron oxygenase ferredoxin subunit [Candidatus Gottesmanbacteria bacterium]|nr:non-heme iron oxygenase ferredoxin subunit [Candidatus Gottesmanbacteria bacterium]
MGEFVKVGKISEVTNGKMKVFNIGGKQIAIANIDGEYLAFDDACTHAQCSLAGGMLDGHTLTCYCHGAQFDIKTGKVLAPPASSPISIYKVKVEGEDIFIEI